MRATTLLDVGDHGPFRPTGLCWNKAGAFEGGEFTRLLSQARESAWVSAFLSCAKIAIGGADMIGQKAVQGHAKNVSYVAALAVLPTLCFGTLPGWCHRFSV